MRIHAFNNQLKSNYLQATKHIEINKKLSSSRDYNLIYLITAKGHIEITDTEYSIRTALSIVENGTLLIDPPYKDRSVPFQSLVHLEKYIHHME